MKVPALHRGVVFRAEHDDTFENWERDEPRAKFCIAFNLAPPTASGDVLYFLTTKNVSRYLENPYMMSECLILKKGTYDFFEVDTAIEFDQLWIVPLSKLMTKRLSIRGCLTDADIRRCEEVIRQSRVLLPKHRKLLGL